MWFGANQLLFLIIKRKEKRREGTIFIARWVLLNARWLFLVPGVVLVADQSYGLVLDNLHCKMDHNYFVIILGEEVTYLLYYTYYIC